MCNALQGSLLHQLKFSAHQCSSPSTTPCMCFASFRLESSCKHVRGWECMCKRAPPAKHVQRLAQHPYSIPMATGLVQDLLKRAHTEARACLLHFWQLLGLLGRCNMFQCSLSTADSAGGQVSRRRCARLGVRNQFPESFAAWDSEAGIRLSCRLFYFESPGSETCWCREDHLRAVSESLQAGTIPFTVLSCP